MTEEHSGEPSHQPGSSKRFPEALDLLEPERADQRGRGDADCEEDNNLAAAESADLAFLQAREDEISFMAKLRENPGGA